MKSIIKGFALFSLTIVGVILASVLLMGVFGAKFYVGAELVSEMGSILLYTGFVSFSAVLFLVYLYLATELNQ